MAREVTRVEEAGIRATLAERDLVRRLAERFHREWNRSRDRAPEVWGKPLAERGWSARHAAILREQSATGVTMSKWLVATLLIFGAARGAAAQGDPHSKVLGSLLSHSEEKLRYKAARDLAAMGPGAAPAARAMVKALDSHDDVFRILVSEALLATGRPATSAVVKGLRHKSKRIRFECALLLGRGDFRVKKHLTAIARALKDKDVDVRRFAAQAIQRLGKPGVLALSRVLDAREPHARADAARALGELGKPALTELARKLGAKKPGTRAAAASAFEWLPTGAQPDAVEVLAKALEDESPLVRRAAARAFGGFLEASPVVLPLLVKRFTDVDVDVARAAGEAAGKHGAGAPAAVEAAFATDGPHAAAGLAEACRGLKKDAAPLLARALEGPQAKRAMLAAGRTGVWAESLLPRLDAIGSDDAKAAATAIRRSAGLAKNSAAVQAALAVVDKFTGKPVAGLDEIEDAHYAGNVRATYLLGLHHTGLYGASRLGFNLRIYHISSAGERDAREGARLLLQAVEAGHAPAMEALGDLYSQVRYRHDGRAQEWYTRAAQAGEVRSMIIAGDMLADEKKGAEALAFFERAAAQHHLLAIKRVAKLWKRGHHSGGSIVSSWSTALKWARKAAIRGDLEAMDYMVEWRPYEYPKPVETYAWAVLAAEGKDREQARRKKRMNKLAKELTKEQRREARDVLASLREEMKKYG